MQTLIEIGLSNIAMAAALAVVAVIGGRLCRRPALTHGLWLLVLVKLITPPLFFVPMPFLTTPIAEPTEKEPEALALAGPEIPVQEADPWPAEALPVLPEDIEEDALPAKVEIPEEPPPAEASAPIPLATEASWPVDWIQLGAGIWVIGAMCWLLLANVRLRRFLRLLGQAQPASEDLQNEVQRLAEKFQVRCPAVRLVQGPLSPMIWVLGRTRYLLVPANLLDRLDAQQRGALLAHELAHLRRKDPWVRYLEMIILGLYWWCPLVWWAQRELREAEEECCDAWVLWALPESARAYALALVETVDFLAEARPSLPVLASGFGHVHLLRRRLTMIMRGSTPRALTASGVVLLLAVAALLVPWLPTWGQGQGPAAKNEKKEDPNRALEETLQKLLKIQHDLAKQQQAIDEQRKAVEIKARELVEAIKGKKQEKKFITELDVKQAEEQKAKADAGQKKAAAEAALRDYERALKIVLAQQAKVRPDLDRRLAELEKNLTNVLKEVQNMRRELQQGGPGMRPGFGPPHKGPNFGPQPPGGFGPPGAGIPGPLPPGAFPPPGGGFPPGGLPGGPGAGPGGGFPQPPLDPNSTPPAGAGPK